jgi:hypothetical protein
VSKVSGGVKSFDHGDGSVMLHTANPTIAGTIKIYVILIDFSRQFTFRLLLFSLDTIIEMESENIKL